jgi:hypothetical protein
MRAGYQCEALAILPPGKSADTNCQVGWVCPMAGVEERKSLYHHQGLNPKAARLSYPGFVL